ncbi:hypothetical protein FQA47_005789 [Oryzias melastigma]|uniref:Uncharacterized protein n=1 Tax=Oryzias melastigma TaxID=30732 RepID=A0A834L1W6_ORYME|nr:hypothetical protein FQA47_005789 [Oryzias melastigma]
MGRAGADPPGTGQTSETTPELLCASLRACKAALRWECHPPIKSSSCSAEAELRVPHIHTSQYCLRHKFPSRSPEKKKKTTEEKLELSRGGALADSPD